MKVKKVLLLGNQTNNFVMGARKSKSAVDIELLKEWLAILGVQEYELAVTTEQSKVREWKGPIVAIGTQARHIAKKARKTNVVEIPHPQKHLRYPEMFTQIQAIAKKLAPMLVIDKPKVVVLKCET